MIVAERPRDDRQRLGRRGEDAAAAALRRAGLEIVARRFRRCGAEIDIIAESGDTVVFVEVKARSGTGFGRPSEAVTPVKRRRLVRAALAWLASRDALERPCRFDVVEVLADASGRLDVRHLEDAFRPVPGDDAPRRRRI